MPAGYVLDQGILRKQTASLVSFDVEYLSRAQAFWADKRIAGRYYVESGARSRDQQTYLYAGFIAHKPGFAPANKPGTSEHEYWPGHPARAMDIHPIPGLGGSYDEMHRVAAEYGFFFPYNARLTSPEPWHMQLDPARKAQVARPKAVDEVLPPYVTVPVPGGPGFWRLERANGGVGCFGGAPMFGSLPGVGARVVAPLVDLVPCVRGGAVIGYWIFDQQGHLYSFGDAPYFTDYASQPKWHGSNSIIDGLVQTAGFDKGTQIRYSFLRYEVGDPEYVPDAYDIGREMKTK